jgi:hypothetical protein
LPFKGDATNPDVLQTKACYCSQLYGFKIKEFQPIVRDIFALEAEQNDAFDNSEATDAVVVLVKTTERIYVCHAKLATFSSPQATNGLRLQR